MTTMKLPNNSWVAYGNCRGAEFVAYGASRSEAFAAWCQLAGGAL